MLWRKKVREFEAQKEFNATSLRNQFYSIFWPCRFVYKLELKIGTEGGRERETVELYVSRFVSHQTRPFEFVISCFFSSRFQ